VLSRYIPLLDMIWVGIYRRGWVNLAEVQFFTKNGFVSGSCCGISSFVELKLLFKIIKITLITKFMIIILCLQGESGETTNLALAP